MARTDLLLANASPSSARRGTHRLLGRLERLPGALGRLPAMLGPLLRRAAALARRGARAEAHPQAPIEIALRPVAPSGDEIAAWEARVHATRCSEVGHAACRAATRLGALPHLSASSVEALEAAAAAPATPHCLRRAAVRSLIAGRDERTQLALRRLAATTRRRLEFYAQPEDRRLLALVEG